MATTRAEDLIVCYSPNMVTAKGIWKGDNPLDYSIPLVILQMTIVVATTRIMVFVLKPLRQPRVVSEILFEQGGVILGPSVLGRVQGFASTIFPSRSVMVLETMANVGLVYFLFLVGVEMDLTVLRKTGKRALAVAIGGMILPFVVGICFTIVLHERKPKSLNTATYILLLGVTLSVTAFPVLARILFELKLINSEIGKLAMSSALLNVMCAWILLAFVIATADNDAKSFASLWVLLACVGFVVVCIVFVRPAITWMVGTTSEGEPLSEFTICVILTGAMISGFITDAIGTHSVFGAFVFGLVIPNGTLGVVLLEKLDDFVSGLLLPLFFAISGLKTNFASIDSGRTWGVLAFITFLSCAGKIAGTMLVTMFLQMPYNDGFILGVLMNAKGLVELIVLNIGKDRKVLDDESFSVMVIVAVVMTAIISPIVATMYKPTRSSVSYERRTLQRALHDGELRLLVCIHTHRNVPAIINLLEASNPTTKSTLCIYVLHLVELSGHASGMLIVHNARKSKHVPTAKNRTQAQSDNIINAFESFEQHSSFVSIHPLTAISPFNSIHEDICSVAEDKRVSLVIIPFHKQQTVDGGMEGTNPAFGSVIQNLLAKAPCSVGILVDRGVSGSARVAANEVSRQVCVLFFGGPDDREALAYGWRMCENPGIALTVLRFVPGANATLSTMLPTDDPDNPNVLTVEATSSWENGLDDEYINDFRSKNDDDESIVYTENVVNSSEETVAAIRKLDNYHDLLIVGRGHGVMSPLTTGLTDWSECPGLGAIGDILAESDFSSTVSVLVIQQYIGSSQHELTGSPHSTSQSDDELIHRRTWSPKKTDYI
ncbi:cation/H(+) antiporter 15 [Gossypium hirsutum]|uniref:Cation/H(+) antiporter 15 n=1 Tax=Gossypium hirsutum TaxID=3635 RepID=A0ABM3AYF3_GOSHI|nr:cation/H(+) antiporter 15-like [Gossypium hirsutum]